MRSELKVAFIWSTVDMVDYKVITMPSNVGNMNLAQVKNSYNGTHSNKIVTSHSDSIKLCNSEIFPGLDDIVAWRNETVYCFDFEEFEVEGGPQSPEYSLINLVFSPCAGLDS